MEKLTMCDRCPQARAKVCYSRGELVLFFCGHCQHKHNKELENQGFAITSYAEENEETLQPV